MAELGELVEPARMENDELHCAVSQTRLGGLAEIVDS